MSTVCVIKFLDNPSKIYFAGQLLSGSVQLTLTKSKKVRGIYIEIIGKAHCKWTVGGGRNKRTCIGMEKYIGEITYLVGSKSGEMTLNPGVYDYKFQCLLPSELPTSLNAKIGYISYIARVVLIIPRWIDNETFDEKFTVIRPLDLNNNVIYRQPAEGEIRKTFYSYCCLCCFESNPVTLIARMPVAGYIPGEKINVEFSVGNQSSLDVLNIKAQFIKKIEYKSDSYDTKNEVIILAEKIEDGCSQNRYVSHSATFDVTPLPPTDATSQVCKVRYFIRIIGVLWALRRNVVLDVEVTIGTCALKDRPADSLQHT